VGKQNNNVGKQKGAIEHKMCFDFLYKFCLKYFSFYEKFSLIWSKCKLVFVKYPLFLSDSNGTWVPSTDFRKKKNLKYKI